MSTWRHFLYALKGLAKAKQFVFTVAFTLGITVAALLAVIAVNSAVYLKPLPYPNEDRLFVTNQVSYFVDYETRNAQSTNTLNLWYREQSSFEAFTAVYNTEVFLEYAHGQPLLPASYVLPEYFDILGVEVIKGRAFTEEGEGIDAVNDNVIISEHVWQTYFAGKEDIVGATVNMFGRPWRIVGVVSNEFKEPNFLGGNEVGIWMPWNLVAGQKSWEITYSSRQGLGLLKPGLSAEGAQKDLTGLLKNIEDEWKGEWELIRDLSSEVVPLREVELGDLRMMSLFLLLGSSALLFIAVINTSNLFFTRVVEKNRNLALHAVLGAKRRDLFLNQLFESLIICGLAVILGAFGAVILLQLLPFISQGRMPMLDSISIDWVVLSSALMLGIGIALIFSFITSRLLDFQNLKESIQSSGKGASKTVSQSKLKLLILAQVTMTTFVIVGASLFLAKAISVKSHDLGSNIEHVYNFHAFAGMEPVDAGRQETLEARILQTLQSNEAIQSASISRIGSFRKDKFTMELRTVDNQSLGFFPSNWIDENFLKVSEIQLLTGRDFSKTTGRAGQNEILISESVAQKLGGNTHALGKTLLDFEGNAYQVVGVTANGYHPTFFKEDQGARVYFPKTPFGFPLTVRATPGTELGKQQVNDLLKTIDESLFVYEFHELEAEYNEVVHREFLLIVMVSALIALTLLLCSAGIFGVLSYNINLRRYEIGIRMAVGATRSSVYQNSISHLVVPLVGGLILACSLVILCIWLLKVHVQEFILLSPVLTLVALLAISLVSVAAVFLPTRKLVHSNPLLALKSE